MNMQQEYDYIDLGVLFIDFWKGIKKFWYIIILLMLMGAGGMCVRQGLSHDVLDRERLLWR